eukprot:1708808-Pleurochrysis_carterae.AAC.1
MYCAGGGKTPTTLTADHNKIAKLKQQVANLKAQARVNEIKIDSLSGRISAADADKQLDVELRILHR